jgi:hypothetical protein
MGDPDADGRIILKIYRKGILYRCMDWIQLAQDMV